MPFVDDDPKTAEIVSKVLLLAQDNQIKDPSILDNHFHLIVAGPNLSRTITDMKKFAARQIIDHLQQNQKGWLLNQLAYYKKRHKTKSDYQVW